MKESLARIRVDPSVAPSPIELPWCPSCGAVGSQPGQNSKLTYYCMGANSQSFAQHKRVKMELVDYEPVAR